MIMGLRDIHNTGFVHCDLKPANIMFQPKDGKIYLKFIDFGLCEEYVLAGENQDEDRHPKGTPNFMSRNCHRGKKLSRKDDLESIIYIVVLMINSVLPWATLYDAGESQTS